MLLFEENILLQAALGAARDLPSCLTTIDKGAQSAQPVEYHALDGFSG